MAKHKRLILHHSVTPVGTGAAIAKEQVYHFIIDPLPSGIVWYQSLPDNKSATRAVGGLNSGSYSVCIIGNYQISLTSTALIDSIVQLLIIKCRQLHIHPNNILTHSYVGIHLVSRPYYTECPGQYLRAGFDNLKRRVKEGLWL